MASFGNDGPLLEHLTQTITAYTQITRNPWLQPDTTAYLENGIGKVPLETTKEVIRTVAERKSSPINSFNYFVKEILASVDNGNIASRRKKLAEILGRVRESHIGSAHYSLADLVFDVKAACARQSVVFDNDLFNELIKRQL